MQQLSRELNGQLAGPAGQQQHAEHIAHSVPEYHLKQGGVDEINISNNSDQSCCDFSFSQEARFLC